MKEIGNKSVKMMLAGMAIAALSANVYARGGDGCDYGYGYGERGAWTGANAERMQKLREEHLAALHDKLKLTAQQESAWKKFAASRPILDRTARLDPAEMEKLNAPQRLEKNLEHMRAVETRLTEHLAVLKEFYAVLTPEQQKIFDEETPYRGPRWQKHWKK